MLLALPLVFWACNDSKEVDEVKEPVLTLTSAETLEFSAEAATGEISYKLENPVEGQAVAATADVDWINNFQYGEKVTFAVEAHEATEAREGKVTVTYTTLSFEVTVKQAGKTLKPEVAIVAGDAAEFEAEGGNGVIEYELKNAAEGVELNATCEAAWVKAVTVVAADSKVTYTVEANADAQSRNATIVLTYGESKAEATVKQKPFVEEGKSALDLKSEGTAKFTAEGGNGVVKFEVINSKEGVKTEAKCEAAWISGLAVNEANTELAYTVAANNTFEARKATIVITYGEAKLEVAVEQEAHAKPELKITANAVKEFAAEGGNGEFTYELKNAVEGTKLAVECKAEWIKATLDEKNSKVTYTVAANEGEAREAIITLAYGELKAEALVKQVAKGEELKPVITVKAEDAVKEFEAEGGNGEASFTLENAAEGAQVEAKADEAATWISVVAVANNKVTYTVAANETDKAREAKITLTCGEAKAEITVKQKAAAGPVFEQKPAKPEISVKAAGGEGAIGYKLENAIKGVEVAATADVDWLTISEIDTEKCRITYYASETDTKSERTGHITATYGDLSFVVTLIQDGGSEMFSILGLNPYVCSPSAEEYSCSYQVKFPVDRTILPTAEVKYLTAGQEGWITDFEFSVNEEKDEDSEEETTPSTFNETETEGEGETEVVIKDIAQGSIKFNIAANPSDNERQAEITYTYNGKKVTQTIIQETDAAIPMRLIVNGGQSEPDRASILAKKANEGKTWTLTLLDKMDENYGVLQTDLVFSLPEDKASENYLPSGKYTSDSFLEGTVEWVDAYNFVATGSVYHTNNDATVAPITGDDRFVEINVNPDTQVVTVKGQFNTLRYDSANSRYIKTKVTFEYTGPVRGFIYADLDKGITEWNSVYIFNSWSFSGGYEYMVKGNDTHDVEVFNFDLYAVGATDKSKVPAGRYPVMQKSNPVTESFCNATSTMYNTNTWGLYLASGEVVITDNADGTQTLEFDVVDIDGTNHKGSYTGAIVK